MEAFLTGLFKNFMDPKHAERIFQVEPISQLITQYPQAQVNGKLEEILAASDLDENAKFKLRSYINLDYRMNNSTLKEYDEEEAEKLLNQYIDIVMPKSS